MLLSFLLFIPLSGIFLIYSLASYEKKTNLTDYYSKFIALVISILNLLLSFIAYFSFDFSSNQFQYVQQYDNTGFFDIYLGLDGISIYFVLLTTIVMPLALLSNWNSITENVTSYLIIMLLLETLLLAVFLVLDVLLFYIFFESILPPLFLLIGLFGSTNKVRAGFYIFLYTLWGSLFLLLSILVMHSIVGTTDLDALFKINLNYSTQFFLFFGVFIAFAVKTPIIFLNNWLLKAHVESPLGGSIVLAAVVLKLSLYGIFRLMLPILPKISLNYTYVIYVIGVITIIYASFSTLRTTDVKELIAYSSVSHAAVYLIAAFSNVIQGIEGSILLGLGHGFVSSGLFICAGGILYDRSGTRSIHFYKGMVQIMPIFSILFFMLSLGNCGAPLTLNFIGEFMSLYGVFEKLSILGVMASFSIILSAAYTIYMFNRITFGGVLNKSFTENITDITRREFILLVNLISFTVIFGINPNSILDGLHYNVSGLIFNYMSPSKLHNLVSIALQSKIEVKTYFFKYLIELYSMLWSESKTSIEKNNPENTYEILEVEGNLRMLYDPKFVGYRISFSTRRSFSTTRVNRINEEEFVAEHEHILSIQDKIRLRDSVRDYESSRPKPSFNDPGHPDFVSLNEQCTSSEAYNDAIERFIANNSNPHKWAVEDYHKDAANYAADCLVRNSNREDRDFIEEVAKSYVIRKLEERDLALGTSDPALEGNPKDMVDWKENIWFMAMDHGNDFSDVGQEEGGSSDIDFLPDTPEPAPWSVPPLSEEEIRRRQEEVEALGLLKELPFDVTDDEDTGSEDDNDSNSSDSSSDSSSSSESGDSDGSGGNGPNNGEASGSNKPNNGGASGNNPPGDNGGSPNVNPNQNQSSNSKDVRHSLDFLLNEKSERNSEKTQDKKSTIDFILDKESTEMPSIFDADGGD